MKKYGNIFIYLMLLFLLFIASCATKDLVAPEISYIQKNGFISPNGDGVQDELDFEVNMRDDSFVKYWKLEIFDSKNKIIKTFSSGGTLEEVRSKTFFPKGDVNIPKTIKWDGKDDNGKLVPDGTYYFRFIAMDGNKNVTPENTKKGVVVVDTDKPEVNSSIKDTMFSPNGDGNKDVLYIDLDIIKAKVDTAVKGQVWYVDIINNKGEVVKKFSYTEKGKQKLEWDGKDEEGNQAPDGEYSIKVYSTDEAGNYWENLISKITIETKPTPVEVKALSTTFSPNNDKVKDAIDFKFDIPVTNGVVDWNFKIINPNNDEVKSFSGKGMPPLAFSWNGKDENDNVCAEGTYRAVLGLTYTNGNKPSDQSEQFTIDVTPPNATATLSPDVFSPDGNGKQDEVIILQNLSKEEEIWKGVIYNEKGKIVKNFSWSDPPKKIEWDGKDDDGKLNPDGTYYYQLICTDKAGNPFESNKYMTKIYTEDTPIFITAALNSFSPNGDKIADKQIFEIKISKSKENTVRDWKFSVLDKNNKVVYTLNKTGDVPDIVEWDGIINKKSAPESDYTGVLDVTFKAGTTSTSKSKTFFVDNTPPDFILKTSPKYFSPDEDGEDDELTINTQAKDPSGIKSWKILIMTPNKQKIFKTFEGVGDPIDNIKWNGISDKGDLVESVEDYPIKVIASDNVGNVLEKDFTSIAIDILVLKLGDGRLKVRISNIQFKPNKAEMTSSPKNREILTLLGKALNKYGQYNIILEGHANKYREGLNETEAKDLSKRRGITVSKELIKEGIKAERMSIVGKGFDEPIIPLKANMTKDERDEMERNRRVEFYLVKAQ